MANKEQKPASHERLPDGLEHDPRFTDELIEALKGEAGLADETVRITDYEGTKVIGDEAKHYLEYEDPDGNTKNETLDLFLWSDISDERKQQLRDAGLDPHDLATGEHSIFRPADQAPTQLLDNRDVALAAAGAELAIGRFMGRRQGVPHREQADVASSLPASPENFEERVAEKLQKKREEESKAGEKGQVKGQDVEAKREHLDKLVEIAAQVAEKLNEKAEEERQRQERKGVEEPNPYEPELTVAHRWDVHKKRRKITRTERAPKLEATEEADIVRGWLLARTASVLDRNRQTQEVILGEDGKLHVYVRASMSSSMKLLGNPMTRQGLQDSFEQELIPPEGKVYLASRSAEVKVFHTITSGDQYPLPSMSSYSPNVHVFAEPGVVQQGLEDLMVEKNLLFSD